MRALRRSILGHVAVGYAAIFLVSAGSAQTTTDPTSELPGGGLVYAGPPDLVTDKEDITIAADRVRAIYVVRNAGADAHRALVAFALPDVDMLALDGSAVDNPAYDANNPDNYVGFTALVDGQPVETFVESRALALGLVDGTAKLRELKLPLYPLTPGLAELLTALPEAIRDDLSARGLIRFSDGQWEPHWRLKTTLFWQQPFAAGQIRTFVISYRPVVGTSMWTPDGATALQQRYCVPAAVANDFTRRGTGPAPVVVKSVHFLAYLGAAARGPAVSYRLAIDTGAPTKTAYTCHDGLSTSSAAGSREKSLSAATAEDEVQVLFIE